MTSVPASIPDTSLGFTQEELLILRHQQQLLSARSNVASKRHVPTAARVSPPYRQSNRIVLTPEALHSLASSVENLLTSIRRRIQQLEDATQESVAKSSARAGATVLNADEEIVRMKAILREVDRLEEECEKIKRIKNTVHALKLRVLASTQPNDNFDALSISSAQARLKIDLSAKQQGLPDTESLIWSSGTDEQHNNEISMSLERPDESSNIETELPAKKPDASLRRFFEASQRRDLDNSNVLHDRWTFWAPEAISHEEISAWINSTETTTSEISEGSSQQPTSAREALQNTEVAKYKEIRQESAGMIDKSMETTDELYDRQDLWDIPSEDSDDGRSVFSLFSQGTLDSIATALSDLDTESAYQTLLNLFASDDYFRLSMNRLCDQATIDLAVFTALLGRSLNVFATSLAREVSTTEQKAGALFVSQKIDQLANDLASHYFAGAFSHIATTEIDIGYPLNSDSARGVTNTEHAEGDNESHEYLKVQDFIKSSKAMKKLRRQLDTVTEMARRWNECLQMWKNETLQHMPSEWRSRQDFWLIPARRPSFFESIQLYLEHYSGEKWIWAPLPGPQRLSYPSQTNIGWICPCGETRVQAVSTTIVNKLAEFFEGDDQDLIVILTANRGETDDNSNHACIEASPPQQTSADVGETANAKAWTIQNTSNISVAAPAVASEAPRNPNCHPAEPKNVYLLVCVRNGDNTKADIIELDPSRTDDDFFYEFKKKYHKLRGWWRRWFDPRQFAFCHISKFDKWYVEKLGWVRNELPLANEYLYTPRPHGPEDPYIPPLSEHEWRHRFYRSYQTPGVCGAVVKLPKRDRRFDLELCLSREYIWGLDVQYRISAKIVILWQVAITAAGWVALGWLLRTRSGDLQTAAIPVTLIMGALMVLWLPLSERFSLK